MAGSGLHSCIVIYAEIVVHRSTNPQGIEKRSERWQNKARKGEVGLAGMGGLLLPPNSQKAEFTTSK